MSDFVALFCASCATGPLAYAWLYHRWKLRQLERMYRQLYPHLYPPPAPAPGQPAGAQQPQEGQK